jgi:hypothetical protein
MLQKSTGCICHIPLSVSKDMDKINNTKRLDMTASIHFCSNFGYNTKICLKHDSLDLPCYPNQTEVCQDKAIQIRPLIVVVVVLVRNTTN